MSEPGSIAESPPDDSTFADLSDWRTIQVSGSEALPWLDDLISADVHDLPPGRARPSLLLSPTGGVLASFTVVMAEPGAVLIQDPAQPRPVDRLLTPYVLTSDVHLRDTTGDVLVIAFPDESDAPEVPRAIRFAPSVLGSGAGILVAAKDRADLATMIAGSLRRLTDEEIEVERISAGIVRVGVDTSEGDLPQETGLMGWVSFEKGCYLGQEAVARVSNGGHPRRLVLPVESQDVLTAGEDVLAGGETVGAITSAARHGGRTLAFARIGWDRRDADLMSPRGVALRRRS